MNIKWIHVVIYFMFIYKTIVVDVNANQRLYRTFPFISFLLVNVKPFNYSG